MIYADRTTIGWALAGEVPVRRHGFGSLPMPGWREGAGWENDVISGSRLPHAENPPSGYVCCANNQPVPSAEPGPFLGHDFLDGYRQQRLSRVLSARDDWTVARMGELHLDVLTLTWEEVRDVVLGLPTGDARTARALELLRRWDGRLTAASAAAAVYELFFAEVCERACRRRAPRSWQTASGKGVMKLIPGTTFNARRASFVARLVREQPAGYFDSWPSELAAALAAAVATLEREFGRDAAAWTWGEVRPLTLMHRFGEKKPLDRIFNRGPLPGYGDGTTVNQAGFEYWKPLRHSTVTAHLRAVMEVGDWSRSRFVLLGGQSGNPLSPHYSDLIPLWQRGEGVPIHWDDAEVARATKHELSLLPHGPSTQSRYGAT
jgi:penicillin amidase